MIMFNVTGTSFPGGDQHAPTSTVTIDTLRGKFVGANLTIAGQGVTFVGVPTSPFVDTYTWSSNANVGFQKEGTPAFQNLSPSGFLSHLTALSVP
jgi:hypothetical protein